MRALSEQFLSTSLLLAIPLALAPAAVSAQDPTQEIPQCTATVTPTEIEAGSAALQVTASLSDDIGPVTTFEGPEDSNLKLADPADIPRVEMANPDEAPRPIVMTPETNSVSLWLSTQDVTPGQFEVHLRSDQGD
ncbi:MAG TPA: hypothetical protein VE173_01100, partial [Longimicrobiales bacterium]|nr:hypothetical protein [Longimicrobiales bacterium]